MYVTEYLVPLLKRLQRYNDLFVCTIPKNDDLMESLPFNRQVQKKGLLKNIRSPSYKSRSRNYIPAALAIHW